MVSGSVFHILSSDNVFKTLFFFSFTIVLNQRGGIWLESFAYRKSLLHMLSVNDSFLQLYILQPYILYKCEDVIFSKFMFLNFCPEFKIKQFQIISITVCICYI